MDWKMINIAGRDLGSSARIQSVYSYFIRDCALQYRRVPSNKRYLNIGPGSNIDTSFVNIDLHWRPGIDVCLDIVNGIKFSENRFDGIFTEHCLEHVSFPECVGVVKEIFRILRPGGWLRIIVPDGGLYLDLYQSWKAGDCVPFPYVDSQGMQHLEEDSRYGFTPMLAVNRIFRGYGHRFAWDFETLERVLSHTGFEAIEESSFRQGADPKLLIDSEVRRPQSLYLECRKPV